MANHEIAVQLTVMPAPVEVNRLLFKAVAYSRQAIGLETCQLGREPVNEMISRCLALGGKWQRQGTLSGFHGSHRGFENFRLWPNCQVL